MARNSPFLSNASKTGKVDLPSLGFGMGDVVLLELLKARGLLPKFDANVDVFCLIEDELLRNESLKLISDLRAAGLAVEFPLTPAKSDKQFKRALELKATRTARLEKNPDGALVAKIKHLPTREEKLVAVVDAAAACGVSIP